MVKIFQSRAVGTGVYISFWNLSALVIQVKWLYAQECRFFCRGHYGDVHFFLKSIFNWRIIALRHPVGFYHTTV